MVEASMCFLDRQTVSTGTSDLPVAELYCIHDMQYRYAQSLLLRLILGEWWAGMTEADQLGHPLSSTAVVIISSLHEVCSAGSVCLPGGTWGWICCSEGKSRYSVSSINRGVEGRYVDDNGSMKVGETKRTTGVLDL